MNDLYKQSKFVQATGISREEYAKILNSVLDDVKNKILDEIILCQPESEQ